MIRFPAAFTPTSEGRSASLTRRQLAELVDDRLVPLGLVPFTADRDHRYGRRCLTAEPRHEAVQKSFAAAQLREPVLFPELLRPAVARGPADEAAERHLRR